MLHYQITLLFVIYRLINTLNDWKTAMFAWARCDPEQPGSQLYKEDDGDVYGVHAKSCKGILIISCRGCTCNTYHNIQPQGEGVRITGYVDYGPGLNGNQEASKSTGIHLTSSVLQFIFLSYIGFWFPSSYMLGRWIHRRPINIFILGHHQHIIILPLHHRLDFVCMDGAAVNWAFINSIVNQPMSVARNTTSPIPNNLCCIMDFSHAVKKIRNSLEASAAHRYRHLLTPFGPLLGEHFTKPLSGIKLLISCVSIENWQTTTSPSTQHLKCEIIFRGSSE